MFLKKIVSDQIAHFSYFLGSNGEAAIIDPRRDHHIYLDIANEKDVEIKYIFETHRNEDYLIGSKELQEVTDAKVLHGHKLDFEYGDSVTENETYQIGSLELKILETPGHTDESISITVKDLAISPEEILVFTGDTLFAGDTGRIDLYGENEKNRLAKQLFQSIHKKILTLGDEVIICPAHGKGSVCGANIGELEYTTIGFEKKTNHQLAKTLQEFINLKTSEIHRVPPYFSKMETENKKGPNVKHYLPFLTSLSVGECRKLKKKNAQVLDIRNPTSFSTAHIPGCINIWSEGVAIFAGWFLDYDNPIILIDENNAQLKNVIRYLFRLGYDNLYGYLKNGFSSWYANAEEVESIDVWMVSQLFDHLEDDSIFFVDVREQSTRLNDGYIKGSTHIFVGDLEENLSLIPKEKTVVLYCGLGNKTSIGCSILKKHNYPRVVNVLGGMSAWTKAGYPIIEDNQE